MALDFFRNAFEENHSKTAVVWCGSSYSYKWVLEHWKYLVEELEENGVKTGDIVAVVGDYSPYYIALLFSLIELQTIIVPFVSGDVTFEQKLGISEAKYTLRFDQDNKLVIDRTESKSNHPYFEELRKAGTSGLVLFTSGTSGVPKGAVHNFSLLLKKFTTKRKSLRTINFLMFDHWGGLNTLFHTLANGGEVLTLEDRKPHTVCKFIEERRVELLPTSPTFLNFMVLSEAYKQYDLSSLKIISYGSEPMPESLLQRLNKIFPGIKLQQTYGLIELGVLRSKSKDDGSLWVKLGGDGFETRVVNGILEIKSESAMLGYLNAKSPFTADGWFITGDEVLVDGDYFKVLGRKSEIINVGGEKVYPAEVESVIRDLSNVLEVVVFGKKNPFTGMMVVAQIRLNREESHRDFKKRLKQHCKLNLKPYMIPAKIIISDEEQFGARAKKIRSNFS